MTRTIRDFLIILIATLVVGIPLMTWAADQADASSQVIFQFQAEDEARFPNIQPGDVRTIATHPVPESLVGLTCDVSVTSTNDESVHVNNFARITSNGDQIDVLGTEDGRNGVHATSRTIELGTTIVVTNHIGARALGEQPVGTSISITIGVTCTQAGTTTTTSAPSTTTTSPGSTSTTTTLPTVTTSTTTPITTSTTEPPATSTTAPTESTTTTTPELPPGEDPPASTIPPVTSPPTLPFTGIDESLFGGLLMFAGALVLLGAGVLVAGREGR